MELTESEEYIYKKLPKTNCVECGLATCVGFAVQSTKGKIKLIDCPG